MIEAVLDGEAVKRGFGDLIRRAACPGESRSEGNRAESSGADEISESALAIKRKQNILHVGDLLELALFQEREERPGDPMDAEDVDLQAFEKIVPAQMSGPY
jgi:hypothetical protein